MVGLTQTSKLVIKFGPLCPIILLFRMNLVIGFNYFIIISALVSDENIDLFITSVRFSVKFVVNKGFIKFKLSVQEIK